MVKTGIQIICWMLIGFNSYRMADLPAQQLQGKVEFLLEFQGEKIVPGQQYFSEKLKDSILIETLRFYVSDLQFFAEGKPITEASKMPFLIDSDVPESHSTTLILSNDKQFDEVRFTLGLDSLINVSGALGGDLDPTKGMYWAWQSGYINFKLEGETEACPARNHAFQYHLGGYRPPFQTVQSISVKGKSTRDFRIVVDIAAFLEQMDVSQDYQVMSPNAKAVELSAMLPAMFHAAK